MRRLKLYLARAGVFFFALAGLPSLAWADYVTLIPARDTTLIEVAPDRNNGGEAWFNAGTTQNGKRNRALLQFDFTSALPANAVITSVDLSLEVTRVPGCGYAISPFSLRRMLVSWGEGDKIALDNAGGQGAPATDGEATWNHRFVGGPAWSAPGGAPDDDFVDAASALGFIYGVGDSPYHFTGERMLGDVQDWVNNPLSNFGWIFMSNDEKTPFTARRFGAHESPDVPPVLTIGFEVVPEPGPLVLGGLGLVLLVACLHPKWRAFLCACL